MPIGGHYWMLIDNLTERPIISLEFLCAVERYFHLAGANRARQPVLPPTAIGELCAVSPAVSDGMSMSSFTFDAPLVRWRMTYFYASDGCRTDG